MFGFLVFWFLFPTSGVDPDQHRGTYLTPTALLGLIQMLDPFYVSRGRWKTVVNFRHEQVDGLELP